MRLTRLAQTWWLRKKYRKKKQLQEISGSQKITKNKKRSRLDVIFDAFWTLWPVSGYSKLKTIESLWCLIENERSWNVTNRSKTYPHVVISGISVAKWAETHIWDPLGWKGTSDEPAVMLWCRRLGSSKIGKFGFLQNVAIWRPGIRAKWHHKVWDHFPHQTSPSPATRFFDNFWS